MNLTNQKRIQLPLVILMALLIALSFVPLAALATDDGPAAEVTGIVVKTFDGSADAAAITAAGSYQVQVTVKNSGSGALSPSVALYETAAGNDVPVDVTQNCAELAAGDTATLNYTWTPSSSGTVTLKAVVETTADGAGTTLATYTTDRISVAAATLTAYDGQTDAGSYSISGAAQLVQLATAVNGGNTYAGSVFVLENDIDLSTVCGTEVGNWTPIGNSETNCFSGTFDGNGKTVQNLYISLPADTSTSYQGLFAYLGNATVKNLTVGGDIHIDNTKARGNYLGGIAAFAANSNFTNCVNKVNIVKTNTVLGSTYGGIVANGACVTVFDCKNQGTINGCDSVAGIAGSLMDGTVNRISDCENDADITGFTSIAGILGAAEGSDPAVPIAIVNNCVNNGNVQGENCISGIGGSVCCVVISSCENTGAVSTPAGSGSCVAGIAGMMMYLSLSDCVNSGAVSNYGPDGYTGGIVGQFGCGTITDCSNSGAITGGSYCGGILGIGVDSGSTVSLNGCYNTGNVIGIDPGTSETTAVGGLAGMLMTSMGPGISVENCFNTGDITAIAEELYSSDIGGLVGNFFLASPLSSEQALIKSCYNAGAVGGSTQVGGLIGNIPGSGEKGEKANFTMSNCYSAAPSVTAVADGGIAGAGIGCLGVGGSIDASSQLILTNVFARSYETLPGIGNDDFGVGACAVTVLNNGQMIEPGFTALLGGKFAWWTDISAGVAADHQDAYNNVWNPLYSDYSYPVLPSLCGVETSDTLNVQFTGAQNTTVIVNDAETYATTVAAGGSVSFTVESNYPGKVTVTSVKVGETELTPNGGVYTLSGITADTVITVTTEGTPPQEDDPATTTYPVSFTVKDPDGNVVSDATVAVTGQTAEDDGSFKLVAGTYTATITKDGYHDLSGSFTVSKKTDKISVTLYPASVAKHTLTLKTGSQRWYADLYNGDLIIGTTRDTTEKETVSNGDYYYVTNFTLPAGSYTYRANGNEGTSQLYSGIMIGAGPLTVSGDDTVILRIINFSENLSNPQNVNYTMTVADPDGVKYTPGSTSVSGGAARGWFVLPAAENGAEYSYAFVPKNVDAYWASSGTTYVYPSPAIRFFGSLNTSDCRSFIFAAKTTVTLTAPSAAALHLYYRVGFYDPLEELKPNSSVDNKDGTVTYTYDAPKRTYLHYELELDGYVKQARKFNTANVTDITISKSDLIVDNGKDIVGSKYDSDIVMNAPDSKYIELNSGGNFELYCFRNWQAIDSGTDNYYVDPDYDIEVVSGDSVEVTDPYYAGATVKAVDGKSGVSVVRVTYGALDFANAEGSSYLYSKLYEQNTVMLIFNVNPAGSATIDTGIDQTEFETAYYTRSINGVTRDQEDQYAAYTFTPTVTGGTLADVAVHAPVGSDDAWDDGAWTKLSSNDDGSYTAKLTDGRSIIRVTAADGSVAYHSLKAYGVDVTVAGNNGAVTLKDGEFSVGAGVDDTVKISFSGLQMPFPKLGAIYNPGYPDKTYSVYTLKATESGSSYPIESRHSQYDIATVNNISFNFDSPDTYVLTGGKIHTTSIGGYGAMHRYMTKGGLMRATANSYSGGQSEETVNGNFSTLPDITFDVTGVADSGDRHTVTIEAPADLTNLTVRNALGYKRMAATAGDGTYTFSLVNDGSSATYTYYAERCGKPDLLCMLPSYITQVGTFTVSDSDVNLDLNNADWQRVDQGGKTNVNIVGYAGILAQDKTMTINMTTDGYTGATDLAAKGYVTYNHGGWTVLHALLFALDQADVKYTCSKGVLTPTVTTGGGDNAGWICEVNGNQVTDYANTLVNRDDQVVFYYNAATSDTMVHAWFTETAVSAAKDGSADLTLMGTAAPNDGSEAAAVAGATVFIDGKAWGDTGSDGKITLSNLSSLSLGTHVVTAQKNDGAGNNTLTYARSILTITKSTSGDDGDKINVSFRLIGDTKHSAAYGGYINWVKTETYTLDKGSTVGDLFTQAMDDNNLTCDAYKDDNYVAWIGAPSVLGGYELAEFNDGANSGWMYTVNGTHPDVGLNYCTLSNGDEVIWHYVNDYLLETGSDGGGNGLYLNSWLSAKDVEPYDDMITESAVNAAATHIVANDSPVTKTLTPSVTATGGTAEVSLDLTDLVGALSDTTVAGSEIIIAPTISGDADVIKITLDKNALKSLADQEDTALFIQTPLGQISLSGEVVDKLFSQVAGNSVTISMTKVGTAALTAAQQKLVGDNAVYDISIFSGILPVSGFGDNTITISLPYTLKDGQSASDVNVWYLNDAGTLDKISAVYSEDTGLATFDVGHLSTFVLGVTQKIQEWTNPFKDVAGDDWFYGAVQFADENDLMTGISSTRFAPNEVMTRAMAVTVLYRLAGSPAVTASGSFKDVASGTWYSDAVNWASANQIVKGYNETTFGPAYAITREQLVTIVYRYASYMGYDVSQTTNLDGYKDIASLSDWAETAMSWSVANGIIKGRTATTLSPDARCTRAEMATVMMRFAEKFVK